MNISARDHSNGALHHDSVPARNTSLRERNKRLGTVVALIAILLMLLAMAYIYWFGGVNKGPMKPLHSSLVTTTVGWNV